MVMFNEEGQGFWEFIYENCSEEYIARIQSCLQDDFYKENGITIYSTRVLGEFVRVYLKVYENDFFVHDYNIATGEINSFSLFQTDLKILKEAISDVK